MKILKFDVLCVGHACYDLIFGVARHVAEDEKSVATSYNGCGGGPASNAAVAAARLGVRAGFAGYLGNDPFGEKHFSELRHTGVITDLIVRGKAPTPLSIVLVKPDGNRALVNYRGDTAPLTANAIDFDRCTPRVILFDGHEPELSLPLAKWAAQHDIPTILDAGSVHDGTRALIHDMTYLVASEKFARAYTGSAEMAQALYQLSQKVDNVVVTLGHRGLIWKNRCGKGRQPAFPVKAVDTTGAGDTFHGAFAAGLAKGMDWETLLKYASAAAA